MCPRAYMYSHEWNLSTTRIGGMEFGQNVHKIIETILRKIIGGSLIDEINIKKEVESAWKASNTRSLSSDEKYKKAALEQINTFVENSKSFLTKDFIHSSEDLFNISVGGNLVTGRFDAVFKNDCDYLIVDFKTGDPRNYSGQLSFYSVCFREKYNVETPIRLAVYYLKSGKYELVEGSNPDDEIQSIIEIADKIRNKAFDAKPGKVCGDCAFNKICPYKK
jgi:CRISPR/Cas system-associated exonuclease Cas4 (RecB family)